MQKFITIHWERVKFKATTFLLYETKIAYLHGGRTLEKLMLWSPKICLAHLWYILSTYANIHYNPLKMGAVHGHNLPPIWDKNCLSSRGQNSGRINAMVTKNMSCTSLIYTEHICKHSFQSIEIWRRHSSHKVLTIWMDRQTDPPPANKPTDWQGDSIVPHKLCFWGYNNHPSTSLKSGAYQGNNDVVLFITDLVRSLNCRAMLKLCVFIADLYVKSVLCIHGSLHTD